MEALGHLIGRDAMSLGPRRKTGGQKSENEMPHGTLGVKVQHLKQP